MLFTSSSRKLHGYTTSSDPDLTTDASKFLGIYLDPQLKWTAHIDYLGKKLSSVFYMLSVLKHSLSIDVLKKVYYAYFYSHVSYGIIFWGSSTQIINIFMIQKKIVRTICNAPYRAHCKPLFRKLEILTIPSIYILKTLLFTRHNISLLEKSSVYHQHFTRRINDFHTPQQNLETFSLSPKVSGIKFYNALPTTIKNIRGVANDWLKSYLDNRQQIVSVSKSGKRYASNPKQVPSGIPQGSVLSPILFLVFINDLPRYLTSGNDNSVIMYADDVNVLISNSRIEDHVRDRAQALQVMTNWCNSNCLSLNSDKTLTMLFTSSSRKLHGSTTSSDLDLTTDALHPGSYIVSSGTSPLRGKKIVGYNARVNKLTSLEVLAHEENPDFMCISEHWLKEVSVSIPEYFPATAFCRTHHRNGGVVIFAKKSTKILDLPTDLCTLNQELIFESA
ncbi:hypothetical protein J437_LFUL009148, partial [Ladona fulva]